MLTEKVTMEGKLRQLCLVLFLCLLSDCSSVGFVITYKDPTKTYPSSDAVNLIEKPPTQPYVSIAYFKGSEPRACESGYPYCSLRKKAKMLGADAIWIKRNEIREYPDQWININGRPTRIFGNSSSFIEGELIRYCSYSTCE